MNKINKMISLIFVMITFFTLPSFSFDDEEKYLVLNSKQAVQELDKKIQEEEVVKPTHIAITEPGFIRTSDYMHELGLTLNEWGVTHFKARNIGLTSDDIYTMREFFRHAESLKYFDLTDNKIGPKGFQGALWGIVISPSRIPREVDLRGNELIDKDTIEDVNYKIYMKYVYSNHIIDTKVYLDDITIPYNIGVIKKIPLWLGVANNWVDGYPRNEEEGRPFGHVDNNVPDILKTPAHTVLRGLRDLTYKTEECVKGIGSLFSGNSETR